MTRLKTLLATAAASLLGLAPLAANATLILQIDDLSTVGVDKTIYDNDANDASALAGVIQSSNLSIGGFVLSFDSGIGTIGNALPNLHLDSLDLTGLGAGTLRISLTETDLTFGGISPYSFGSSIGAVAPGVTIGYAAYVDDSNAAFGTTTQLFAGSNTGTFADGGSANVSITDPFSLTLVLDITTTGSSTTSNSVNFEAHVPEPGTLALLSAALLGAGVAVRRRRT